MHCACSACSQAKQVLISSWALKFMPCAAQVVVPAIAAIVLDIQCSADSNVGTRCQCLRPCPADYPPCAASIAAAGGADVAKPAQDSFAHLGPAFFECCQVGVARLLT